MKKLGLSVIALSLIALVSGSQPGIANAQEKDLTVVVGMKTWLSTWDSWELVDVSGDGTNDSLAAFKSDTEMALIPSVTLKYDKLFVSLGWMNETDYGFPEWTGSGATPPAGLNPKREEMDLNVGYSLTKNVSIAAGYKEITQTWGGGQEWEYSGPTLGVMASSSIGGRWGIYGNFSVGKLDVEAPGFNIEDANYLSSELGFAYVPTSWLSLTLGYKYQALDTAVTFATGTEVSATDATKGLILGANLMF